jgi:hypothetical protein
MDLVRGLVGANIYGVPLMDVHVRGIDPEVWRALRVEALQRGISVAKVIEELWLGRQKGE